MSFNANIGLQGFNEVRIQFDYIAKKADSKEIEDELVNIGNRLRDKIKAKAPLGPTGNLKRSIVSYPFKRKVKYNPASFVAVDRSIAKHYHLVEFGSPGIRIGKVGAIKYRGRSFGVMPKRPFFRPTVDQQRSIVENEIAQSALKLINKYW